MAGRPPRIAVLYAAADATEHAKLSEALRPLEVAMGASIGGFVDGAEVDRDYFDLVVALLSDDLLGQAAAGERAMTPYARRLAILVTRCLHEGSAFTGWPLLP